MNHDLMMHSCKIGANNHSGGKTTGVIYYVFTLLNLCFIRQHVVVLMRIIMSFLETCLSCLLHDWNIMGLFFLFILYSHNVVFGYFFHACHLKLIKIINLYNLGESLCHEPDTTTPPKKGGKKNEWNFPF